MINDQNLKSKILYVYLSTYLILNKTLYTTAYVYKHILMQLGIKFKNALKSISFVEINNLFPSNIYKKLAFW